MQLSRPGTAVKESLDTSIQQRQKHANHTTFGREDDQFVYPENHMFERELSKSLEHSMHDDQKEPQPYP